MPWQWKGRNLDPPQLPHFPTELSETQNQERYPGCDPACTIWLTSGEGKGVCENSEFWFTVGCFLFFVFLSRPPGHIVGPITTNEGSKGVFPQGSAFSGCWWQKQCSGIKLLENMFLTWIVTLHQICDIFKSRHLKTYTFVAAMLNIQDAELPPEGSKYGPQN